VTHPRRKYNLCECDSLTKTVILSSILILIELPFYVCVPKSEDVENFLRKWWQLCMNLLFCHIPENRKLLLNLIHNVTSFFYLRFILILPSHLCLGFT
jgi:hypothetical protein